MTTLDLAIEYACCGCGARFVTYAEQDRPCCPSCGAPLAYVGAAPTKDVPTQVAPFAIGRDRAIKAMRTFVEYAASAPTEHEIRLRSTEAMYVPCWLFEVKAQETVAFLDIVRGTRNNSCGAARKSVQATYNNVPVSASACIPDRHMRVSGLYWLRDLCAPKAALANTPLAEAPAASAREMYDRAKASTQRMLHGTLMYHHSPYTAFIGTYVVEKPVHLEGELVEKSLIEIVERSGEARITDSRLCALPIWLLRGTCGEEDVVFVVNGQTGSCAGDAPMIDSEANLDSRILRSHARITVVSDWRSKRTRYYDRARSYLEERLTAQRG